MADVVTLNPRRRKQLEHSLDDTPAPPTNELATTERGHPLDSEQSRALHRRLMSWFYYERDRQASNRLEMAIDHDFYDNDQWEEEDKAIVEERGQLALTYNEVGPMADWLIGTERRNRVDWKVLPRTEDDVQMADVKTKTLKYVSDVNKVVYARSRAFADAVKGGEGYVDDGVRDDPTKDILYSAYESWRHVLFDSSGQDLCGDDGRYVFRWRWVDEDIALMMFPDRKQLIREAVEDFAHSGDPEFDDLAWRNNSGASQRSGALSPWSSTVADAQRRRLRLIECQYREPVATKFVADGPLQGAMFDQRDRALAQAVANHGSQIVDRITMRVHQAVFTEGGMLSAGPSAYRHNRFSLTRLVCYLRNRDRMPYGVIRRVRSIQQDLNKRASKALWLLSTNQLIADRDAFDDWDEAAEEAQMPDGRLKKKPGAEVVIRRDTDAATGQLQLMAMAAGAIQKSAGVTDENLGRKTNAVSGEAIKARQQQGSVVTTEPFDNLRLFVQCQGEKQLSLIEQFYTTEKVVRLTGVQGGFEWVRINQPEVQADGTVRWINDVTASMADFIVEQADYAGTLRQVMFDSMRDVAQRMPPEMAVRFLRIAFEFSDLPNKREIVDEIRKLTGERDPNKEMSPEEAQQAEAQMRMQTEAMEVQRQTAHAMLAKAQAEAEEITARAEKIRAEAQAAQSDDPGAEARRLIEQERAINQVREQAQRQIEALSEQLAKVTAASSTEIMRIKSDRDTKTEVARIQAEADVRAAEVQRASEAVMQRLMTRLDEMAADLQDATAEMAEAKRQVEKLEADAQQRDADTKAREKAEAAATPAAAPAAAAAAPAAAAPAPAQPVTVVVQPAPAAAAAKVKFEQGADGGLKGAVLTREDGTELRVEVEGGADKPAKKDGGT